MSSSLRVTLYCMVMFEWFDKAAASAFPVRLPDCGARPPRTSSRLAPRGSLERGPRKRGAGGGEPDPRGPAPSRAARVVAVVRKVGGWGAGCHSTAAA
jgi:hypothetical protein